MLQIGKRLEDTECYLTSKEGKELKKEKNRYDIYVIYDVQDKKKKIDVDKVFQRCLYIITSLVNYMKRGKKKKTNSI